MAALEGPLGGKPESLGGCRAAGDLTRDGREQRAETQRLGEYGDVISFESPDKSAAAGLLAAISPGHVKAIKTTTLIA